MSTATEAPPYLENPDVEVGWLRADLAASADDARALFGQVSGMDEESARELDVRGPVAMRLNERWVLCPDDEAQARYWQLSFP